MLMKAVSPIFVVDDEKSICDSLRGIFTDEGYEIVTCLNARTLFEKAAKTPPATKTTTGAVERNPTPNPRIITVAGPVCALSAMDLVGL